MLQITIYNPNQHSQWRVADDHIVLARGGSNDHNWRLLSATRSDSLSHFVELQVTSAGLRVTPQEGCAVAAVCGATRSDVALPLPASFVIEDTRFEIADADRLRDEVRLPLTIIDAEQFSDQRDPRRGGPSPATLGRWLESLACLHRHPASDQQFYRDAAQMVVDPIGLDGGVVLRRRDDAWEIIASYLPKPELGIAVDESGLDVLVQQPRTHFQAVDDDHASRRRGRVPSSAVVTAPLVDDSGQLVGAIYGFRALHHSNSRRGVRYLEAQLVDLVARSVASGMARLEREAAAAERRSALAQRLPRKVAQQVELDDRLLDGQQNEITVLFADLRGFTELCQRLDTRRTYAILNDVMDCLTDAALAEEGTVIDYYGDGLSVMWNAPVAQADHAARAVRAALAMVESLPRVSKQWRDQLRDALEIGIGLHTGPAVVGNIGSSQHLKYGPRGATVNLASRIEATTKKLGTSIVASTATQSLLGDEFLSYRLCEARLKDIDPPVDLYAVHRSAVADSVLDSEVDRYTRALDFYEHGAPSEACRLLESEPMTELAGPAAFLARQIQQDCSRKLGRRAGDSTATCGSAIEV